MATIDRSALIDGEKRIGTVTKVAASGIELNLPQALAAAGRRGVARGTVGGKAIVFDPTGEFSGKLPGAVEYVFTRAEEGQTLVRFPSEAITELSLFALLRPTGQSQGPTMREAIRSLRLARALANDRQIQRQDITHGRQYFDQSFGTIWVEQAGTIRKTGQKIAEFNRAAERYATAIATETCNFDVHRLTDQIAKECIWPDDRNDKSKFGGPNDSTLGYCNTLIVRMRGMLASAELQCLFGTEGEDICTLLDGFLNNVEQRICLISFKNVSFNHNARELLLNTIGEYLLAGC